MRVTVAVAFSGALPSFTEYVKTALPQKFGLGMKVKAPLELSVSVPSVVVFKRRAVRLPPTLHAVSLSRTPAAAVLLQLWVGRKGEW